MKEIPLGTEWLGCKLIYQNGQIFKGFETLEDKIVKTFNLIHSDILDGNIWSNLNSSQQKFFPAYSYRKLIDIQQNVLRPRSHSLSSPKKEFLKSEFGLPYLNKIRNNVQFLSNINFGASVEFIIQNYEDEKKDCKGKSILILGGGPSLNEIDFSSVKADSIWASNNFFKNNKLNDFKIDAVAVTPYINLDKNSYLLKYIKNNPHTKIHFETERGDYEKDWKSMYDFMKENKNQSFLYGTRYRSKLGITPRQICLAIFLGYEKIYIAGFDGLSKAQNNHGFEIKKDNALWYDRLGGPNVEIMQFVQYWDYIFSLKQKYNFNIINLSENSRYNISSEITKWLKLHN